jgi:hypothetical protein
MKETILTQFIMQIDHQQNQRKIIHHVCEIFEMICGTKVSSPPNGNLI